MLWIMDFHPVWNSQSNQVVDRIEALLSGQ